MIVSHQLQSAKIPDTNCLQAAATARLAGKADIFKASENGYTAVVADHLIVDPACVRNRDPSQ